MQCCTHHKSNLIPIRLPKESDWIYTAIPDPRLPFSPALQGLSWDACEFRSLQDIQSRQAAWNPKYEPIHNISACVWGDGFIPANANA
ncbi:MAG: hypothetical protein QM757_38600 [Paludibaculum sp.]